MKQDGSAGTPRQPDGPPEEHPAFQFADDRQAFEYIVGRGRTKEQLTGLVAAAQMGLAVAEVMSVFREVLWLGQERGPASRPTVGVLSVDTEFVRRPPKEIASALQPAVALGAFAIEAVNAARPVVEFARKLREALTSNPELADAVTHMTSGLQMAAAFSLLAAEEQNLQPRLGRREMEAVAWLVGFREPQVEAALKTDLQEDNWRKMIVKVEEKLLPVLRALPLPSQWSTASSSGPA